MTTTSTTTPVKRLRSFPLRLSPVERDKAAEIARREGLSLNHFISLAIAEKLSHIEHQHWPEQGRTYVESQGLPADPKSLDQLFPYQTESLGEVLLLRWQARRYVPVAAMQA